MGGLLPADTEHHRVGRPSLLIRCSATGRGYHPVQIKFHKVMETRPVEDATLRVTFPDLAAVTVSRDGR